MHKFVCGLLTLLLLVQLSAYELDWDEVNWPTGQTSHTFRNVDGSDVDMQITLSISSGQWSRSKSIDNNRKEPNDNNYYDGNYGHAQGEESLLIFPDFINNNHTNAYVDVVIRFMNRPQSYVSFDLFDVDHGYYWNSINGYEFEDIIENIEGSNRGQKVGPSSVTAGSEIWADTSSDPGDTLYRGDSVSTDESSSIVSVSWADQPVDQVSFRYSSGSRAGWNPGDQAIGLSDIRFSNVAPVPEASTVFMGGLLFASCLFWGVRKHLILKKQSQKEA